MIQQGVDFSWISRNHVNKWDDSLQQAVPGWEMKILNLHTGTTLPVFVPDDRYSPDNVTLAIANVIEQDNAVHNIGT